MFWGTGPRLVLELRESTDESVRNANAKVPTGRKWNAQTEVDQAVGRLQHREIMGRVQVGRAGSGWGETPCFWSKANRKQRKEMVVAEVTRMEEDRYKIKAVSQGRQGSWTTWEGIMNRNISWSDVWKIPQARLSFLIHSTYDTLPCPWNLHQWFGNEESCLLCNAPNASLQHILAGCKVALSQGRYRWRHDQVLRKLAEVLEECRQGSGQPPSAEDPTIFVSVGGKDEQDDSTIELSKVQSVKVVARKRRERGLPRAFEIFTDSKSYVLKARDEKHAEEWLQYINVAVAQAKERENREATTYL
ncbi:hypothetical protein UPYG_G00204760 [Umbra pygmaea]|uniref:PH domain-containing protein n=1 Tax=Umbra pygmaea TaxID=75934 RepID=A0ABD0WKI9_UMBPY